MKHTLDKLAEGASARVQALHSTGPIRSRLQDIGLIPGTKVTCVQIGAGLAAYRIRGAVIALRDQDARDVTID